MKTKQIIPAILHKIETEAIQHGRRPNIPGMYRVSEIGGCARALQYSLANAPHEIPSPEAYMIFNDGHTHHEQVRGYLRSVGTLSNVEMGISKEYEWKSSKFLLVGTIDGIFEGMPFDIKSMNTFAFKYLDKNWNEGKLDNYKWQLTLYMDMLAQHRTIKRGFLLFKDKNTGELRLKVLKPDPKTLEKALDRVLQIHKAIERKDMVPKPYTRNDWHCKLCPFRKICHGVSMERRVWPS